MTVLGLHGLMPRILVQVADIGGIKVSMMVMVPNIDVILGFR